MKRKSNSKFKSASRPNTNDDRGAVQVCVILRGEKGHVKGNITKYLTLQDTKVSVVYDAIEEALLE